MGRKGRPSVFPPPPSRQKARNAPCPLPHAPPPQGEKALSAVPTARTSHPSKRGDVPCRKPISPAPLQPLSRRSLQQKARKSRPLIPSSPQVALQKPRCRPFRARLTTPCPHKKPAPYPFIPRSRPPETALSSLSRPAHNSLPAQKASPLFLHLPKSPSRNCTVVPFAPGPQLPVCTKIAFTRSLLCHLIFSPATKLKSVNSFKQLYYPILVS